MSFTVGTLTTVDNAAMDAFSLVATDIRKDLEFLNYTVAGLDPGGVAGGFGYNSNQFVKSPPPPPFTSFSPPTSPKSRGPKGSQGRHPVGLGLPNPHIQNWKQYLQAHGLRNPSMDFRRSTSGFIYINTPPGSGTLKFPIQKHSQSQPANEYAYT